MLALTVVALLSLAGYVALAATSPRHADSENTEVKR